MNIPKPNMNNAPWYIILGMIAVLMTGAVFDNTGKEWINISGSSVAVTNDIQTATAASEQTARLSNVLTKTGITVTNDLGVSVTYDDTTNSTVAADYLAVLPAIATNASMPWGVGKRAVLRVDSATGLLETRSAVSNIVTITLDGEAVTIAAATTNVVASQGLQVAGNTHLATIAGDTTSLDGKDFATETTLATMLTEATASERLLRLSNVLTKTGISVTNDLGVSVTYDDTTNSAVAADYLAVLPAIATNASMSWGVGKRAVLRVDSTTGLLETRSAVTNTVVVDATGSGDVPITLAGETVVLGAGSAAFGKLAANSGVDIGDVDVLSSALPSGASTEATLAVFSGQNSNRLATLDTAAAALEQNNRLSNTVQLVRTQLQQPTNGVTMFTFRSSGAVGTNVVKASAGTVYSVSGWNTNNSKRWLYFYNLAGTPATNNTILFRVFLPANAGGSGNNRIFPVGLPFNTGIGFAVSDVSTPTNAFPTLNAGGVGFDLEYK